MIARFRPLLAEHDLTEQQWRIIRVLLESGPLEPREILELEKSFHVDVEYPELVFFRLISSYLLKGLLKKQFKMLDNYFYRYPGFRKYSYSQHLFLS